MTKLKPGDKAPLFSGSDHQGNPFDLKKALGKKIVLYFYPKDNTPACTAQACSLRDHYKKFQSAGYDIIGISTDSVKKHQNFIKKFSLPFTLISDPDHLICDQYGVWGEKMLFGRKYMGIVRTTFVLSERGNILDIIDKVDTANHAGQLL